MCLNDLNYLQNGTSRLCQVRRTCAECRCQSKNVLEELVSLQGYKARRAKYISRILQLVSLPRLEEQNIFRGF